MLARSEFGSSRPIPVMSTIRVNELLIYGSYWVTRPNVTMDTIMLDRGQPLSLWRLWWNAILLLRPAFSRLRTFMWFATIVAGLTVRVELLGVTSIVRFTAAASSLIGCRPCGGRLC